MNDSMSWFDNITEDPARAVWARKAPAPINGLPKVSKALGELFGDGIWLRHFGSFLIAYTAGESCDCGKCSAELQRVIDTTPGLPFSAQMNGPMNRMILCPECGNKRCPQASDHDYKCTGSNDPGQRGSVYQ